MRENRSSTQDTECLMNYWGGWLLRVKRRVPRMKISGNYSYPGEMNSSWEIFVRYPTVHWNQYLFLLEYTFQTTSLWKYISSIFIDIGSFEFNLQSFDMNKQSRELFVCRIFIGWIKGRFFFLLGPKIHTERDKTNYLICNWQFSLDFTWFFLIFSFDLNWMKVIVIILSLFLMYSKDHFFV